jgi:hypothetical protein
MVEMRRAAERIEKDVVREIRERFGLGDPSSPAIRETSTRPRSWRDSARASWADWISWTTGGLTTRSVKIAPGTPASLASS